MKLFLIFVVSCIIMLALAFLFYVSTTPKENAKTPDDTTKSQALWLHGFVFKNNHDYVLLLKNEDQFSIIESSDTLERHKNKLRVSGLSWKNFLPANPNYKQTMTLYENGKAVKTAKSFATELFELSDIIQVSKPVQYYSFYENKDFIQQKRKALAAPQSKTVFLLTAPEDFETHDFTLKVTLPTAWVALDYNRDILRQHVQDYYQTKYADLAATTDLRIKLKALKNVILRQSPHTNDDKSGAILLSNFMQFLEPQIYFGCASRAQCAELKESFTLPDQYPEKWRDHETLNTLESSDFPKRNAKGVREPILDINSSKTPLMEIIENKYLLTYYQQIKQE